MNRRNRLNPISGDFANASERAAIRDLKTNISSPISNLTSLAGRGNAWFTVNKNIALCYIMVCYIALYYIILYYIIL